MASADKEKVNQGTLKAIPAFEQNNTGVTRIMSIRKILTAVSGLGMFALATPASADIYRYTMTNSDVLTINSATESATFVGSSIDVSMTSSDFSSFVGGALPSFTAVLSSLDGVRLIGGKWVNDNPLNSTTSHPQKLLMNGNRVNLWAWWGDPISGGDYVKRIAGYEHVPGNSVPEPGMLGLMVAGLGGIAFARRRRKKTAAA